MTVPKGKEKPNGDQIGSPRAWWDVVTMLNSPSRSGSWQKDCQWLPEQWSRDPLPTPERPGMEGRSFLGPWNVDSPAATVTRIDQRAFPICLDCLRHERASYAALTESLCRLSPADIWNELPVITGRFKPEEHIGHDVLAYRIGQVRGTRSGPDIQSLLASLKSRLREPVARFKVIPRASNIRVHDVLNALMGGSIDEVIKKDVDRSSRPRRQGRAPDALSPPGGERETLLESLGTTLTRAVVKEALVKKGKHVYMVEVESGMNLLNSYLKAILPTRAARYTLDVAETDDATRARFQRQAVTAYVDSLVVQVYLGLLAHRDPEWERARATMVDHDATRSPMEDLAAMPISAAARNTIIGDVLLLQYEVRREAKLPSNTKSLVALFEALDALPYPRMEQTKSVEKRARLERILNLISLDLQRVVITHVDWKPLLRAMAPRFAGRSM